MLKTGATASLAGDLSADIAWYPAVGIAAIVLTGSPGCSWELLCGMEFPEQPPVVAVDELISVARSAATQLATAASSTSCIVDNYHNRIPIDFRSGPKTRKSICRVINSCASIRLPQRPRRTLARGG